jgi:hypothetical protein
LIDFKDVRAQLAGNDSQIELRLGGEELGKRLKLELETLDQYKQTPRGSSINYLDFQNGRIVIGTSSGSKVSSAAGTVDGATNTDAATPAAPKPDATDSQRRSASASDKRPKAGQTKAKRDSATTSHVRWR